MVWVIKNSIQRTVLTKPCLSLMLLVSLSLWNETTFCIHCSPVEGESGWMYILLGISGSALPATIQRLRDQDTGVKIPRLENGQIFWKLLKILELSVTKKIWYCNFLKNSWNFFAKFYCQFWKFIVKFKNGEING